MVLFFISITNMAKEEEHVQRNKRFKEMIQSVMNKFSDSLKVAAILIKLHRSKVAYVSQMKFSEEPNQNRAHVHAHH